MGLDVGLARLIENPATAGVGARLVRQRTVVCAYHGVDDPARFESQIRSLLRRRRPLSGAEFADCVRSGRTSGPPSFLVTFDDGHRSVLEQGAPILQRLGVPGVVFVVAGLIGTEDPFWWDEVDRRSRAGGRTGVAAGEGLDLVRALKLVPDGDRRRAIDELRASAPIDVTEPQLTPDDLLRLEAAGVDVASHSWSHPCLDRCSDAEIRSELVRSREFLEARLGHPVRWLAYPNGNVDDRVASIASESGYHLGFGFDHRLTRIPVADPMRLSRVRVDSVAPSHRFESVVTGVHPWVHHLRGRP